MSRSVLVVDDSLAIRKLVGNMLVKAGFAVTEAANGKQGLEKLGEGKPSLIITDINMPIMDGLEFIRAVRELGDHKFTPIICLTTETEDAKKNAGRDAGATGWIVKPFDSERLMRAIQKVTG